MADFQFKKGTKVEISIDEEGFRGAWFSGMVIKPPTKNGKVLVEYDTLLADENDSIPLREEVDLVQIRPIPPRESSRVFNLDEEVDAYHNDGWWEGVITQVLQNGEYSVYFRPNREQSDFKASDLRLHREWVHGRKWVPPLQDEEDKLHVLATTIQVPIRHSLGEASEDEEPSRFLMFIIFSCSILPTGRQVVQPTAGKNAHQQKEEKLFSPRSLVEVSSDEDGFEGAWFAATIVEVIEGNKYLIEYKDLRTEDDTEFVREEVDELHIRPCPPPAGKIDRFKLYEEVDALYNDGWWVGIISKVHRSKYAVYFKGTNEELEFKHGDLRLHQDWIGGKWVMASQV
ncbi:hypothetical protein Cgig2_022824 [Carnegiea gigantea]|uniref:Agenet domain-containing protein n=1 Tax=Carnegiea gigantea TaxID=171969 RepID=A0A9Q1KNV8_9CARY|nr:hypothetical protein Cgig2_022824 [Carnegiea gigantea]